MEGKRPSPFPGVDNTPADTDDNTTPPGPGKSLERTLADGIETKWCSLYNLWGNHYRDGYPAESRTPAANATIEEAEAPTNGVTDTSANDGGNTA